MGHAPAPIPYTLPIAHSNLLQVHSSLDNNGLGCADLLIPISL